MARNKEEDGRIYKEERWLDIRKKMAGYKEERWPDISKKMARYKEEVGWK